MCEKKITIDKKLDNKQVAAFLRLLAAELEGTSCPEPNEFGNQLHGFNKLKIGLIRQEGGQLLLRLKIKNGLQKGPPVATEFADIAAQDYRPFKQRMKSTFAELTRCGEQGALPSNELLESFMKQSEQLISFSGFGDLYYNEYWQSCLSMKQAVEEGSVTTFQEKLAAIRALKKACHQRFK